MTGFTFARGRLADSLPPFFTGLGYFQRPSPSSHSSDEVDILQSVGVKTDSRIMKATFFLPAHPSYFDEEYTQEEIDRAIKIYDRYLGGIILATWRKPPFEKQFVLLRAPGKSVTVLFETTGYKGDARGIEQYICPIVYCEGWQCLWRVALQNSSAVVNLVKKLLITYRTYPSLSQPAR
jgi:hypothetical protein